MTRLQRTLLDWYARDGRATLPWRTVRDPYYTVVSEFMLQQTQVDRVVLKFVAFIERFPTLASLASASTADVLRMWQGLGYNSRAVRLKALAETVARDHAGILPREVEALRALPGIGPYTAAAIRAFAFDLDDAPVDTNVRRIVHRLYYGMEFPVAASARELDERALSIVPSGAAHDWSSALMDLGATLCTARAPKCGVCPLGAQCKAAPIDAAALETARRKSAKPRTSEASLPFERTSRYARGRIVDRLRALSPGNAISLLDLHRELEPLLHSRTLEDVSSLVAALERDGLVSSGSEGVCLRE